MELILKRKKKKNYTDRFDGATAGRQAIKLKQLSPTVRIWTIILFLKLHSVIYLDLIFHGKILNRF